MIEPYQRPTEEAQIPVPAVSSRSVQNHLQSLCDFVIIQVLNMVPFIQHIKTEKYTAHKTLSHQVLGKLEEMGD